MLIDREFAIDWANSVRQGDDGDPERFGYRSDHYVVQLGGSRNGLVEWAPYGDLQSEIQVRTVMQHAWASVDHKIRYKSSDLPTDLQRRLSRLSALLETADEQFASIQAESRDVAAGYEQTLAGGDFDIGLDVLSLQQYVRALELDVEWMRRAIDLGYQINPFIERYLNDPSSSVDELNLSQVVEALRDGDTESIENVNDFFQSAEKWGGEVLKDILNGSKGAGFVPVALPEDLLRFLVLCGASNLAAVDRTDYKDAVKTGLKAAIRKRKSLER